MKKKKTGREGKRKRDTLDIKKTKFDSERKEGNVLFNDTLNTFYLRLYGVSESERHKEIQK